MTIFNAATSHWKDDQQYSDDGNDSSVDRDKHDSKTDESKDIDTKLTLSDIDSKVGIMNTNNRFTLSSPFLNNSSSFSTTERSCDLLRSHFGDYSSTAAAFWSSYDPTNYYQNYLQTPTVTTSSFIQPYSLPKCTA
ncbi:unnamed protein product [Didymodactylos carnosus]|uniref:Uncharacterized protein n=1 Tax=Didymodactylos carnosus TaxID=1234261 RepID=A0A815P566_9BILA|nr:unnamed protein product [Didymodactylos carnosus]CAF1444255.1 unnamed protein product [Didymodactylos carnosus]CAF4089896.1 unnamed protein product [Didymodactylos carnosus]CAF4319407.1 unnamed protein product [Didymodactylos carnosus]